MQQYELQQGVVGRDVNRAGCLPSHHNEHEPRSGKTAGIDQQYQKFGMIHTRDG